MFDGSVMLRWSFDGDRTDATTAFVRGGAALTTDPSGRGATAADPITTSVTTPVPGTVSITEHPVTRSREPGFNVLGFEVSITAPDATAEGPLVIVFELDASILPPGSTPGDVIIRRNGIVVPDCANAASGAANPDPCVRAREALPNGNARITVLTSRASLWGFLTPNRPPTVMVPADVVAEATGPGGALVTYAASADDPEDGGLTPTCTPASGSIFPLGEATVTCSVEDVHGAGAASSFTVTVRDTLAPTITLTSPSNGAVYLLNQIVAASYSCEDGGSGLATCEGPVPSGGNLATNTAGPVTFAVHAADRAGNTADAIARYQVAYGIRLLYDPTKAKKSGSTVPIKLQITDVDGRNQSSSTITLNAVDVVLVSTADTGAAEDPGSANPDSTFRYDPSLDGVGGYIFNLKTTGYRMGTYHLRFRAGNDPSVHVAEFRIR